MSLYVLTLLLILDEDAQYSCDAVVRVLVRPQQALIPPWCPVHNCLNILKNSDNFFLVVHCWSVVSLMEHLKILCSLFFVVLKERATPEHIA